MDRVDCQENPGIPRVEPAPFRPAHPLRTIQTAPPMPPPRGGTPSRGAPSDPMEHVSPFEALALADRRPAFPMVFFIDVLLEGPLERDRFERAVARASARHPRLRMRVGKRGGRVVWLPPDRVPSVEWRPLGGARDGRDPLRPFDLFRECGFRVVARELERLPGGVPSWSVLLVVDHAVCDGLAALEWLGDLWTIYHGRPPRPLDDGPAASRPEREPSAPPAQADAPASTARRLGLDSRAFAALRPAVLAPLSTPPTAASNEARAVPSWAHYRTVEFDREETRGLRATATRGGVSVNDLIVAASMRTVLGWNAAAGHPSRHVRINMPVNLRPPGARLPAANHIGYAFLDRSADDCDRAVDLVRSLAAASQWIQDTGAAAQFLHAVKALRRVPGLLWLLTRVPVCLSSAVVSNVGNVGPRMGADVPQIDGCDAPGDLRLTAILGIPPLRPRTRLGVGIVTYGGSLRLAVVADERRLGANATALLASRLRDEVVGVAAAVDAASAASPPA